MSARIDDDTLLFAATWLEEYEGAPDDEAVVKARAAAAWLRDQVTARHMRRLCRAAGVPVAALRKRMATIAKADA